MEELDSPIFILKPVFLPTVTLLSLLPLQIFMTAWGAGFFGAFGFFALMGLRGIGFNVNVPMWFTFVFFGCLFFFGIPIVAYIAKKRSYKRTEYRFYPKKLEYYEGFFTIQEKSIEYRQVTEVSLRRGVFQRRYGLGTMVLSTPATGIGGGAGASGILVQDVRDPERVYGRVKELILQEKS